MSSKSIAQLFLRGSRQFSRSAAVSSGEIAPGYKELKNIQAKFQKPDGKPVFLKGGAVDNILYLTTCALCVVGMAGIGKLLYELSYPPKQSDE
ncbi:cytochrome c oxidase subunit 7A, mitochondrial-like [Malaya genurostris]|uniref:cytochrome c oxidase subunit 7A, mitochondrial-like n=1 Tax=Malaya genurostris TaxID=325434 RepID=UPI0026F3FCC9|nr:cytochrome c oxidase subunit 7A, mitochondrial-like [Malaya genurostris]